MKATIYRTDGTRIELDGTPAEIREAIGAAPLYLTPTPWWVTPPLTWPRVEPFPWQQAPWWQPTYTTAGVATLTIPANTTGAS